jgi:hypothetical protein
LPNLALAIPYAVLSLVFWDLGGRAPDALIAGACVGLLDGILGFLARSRTLPHLRKAETFAAAVDAYRQSRWTRARNMIAIASVVVLGVVISRRLEQPAYYSALTLIMTYFAASDLLKALVLAPWNESRGRLPSNTSLERTRER